LDLGAVRGASVTDSGELKIRIERGEGETFRVFASGPSGEAMGEFVMPFAPLELENFILRMGRTRSTMRRAESPEMQLITEFGGKLFDALFQSRVRDLYRDSVSLARGEETRLRISLAMNAVPELMHLPWEYLYDDPAFLSISTWTPVVRYLELPRARRPLKINLPLRILAMVSSPTNAPALDVDRERENLERALHGLAEVGAVEFTWLEDANLRALQRALRREPYHVFHYIGHGAYDPEIADGVLLLEDDQALGRRVTGTELGTMLADHTSLRLAVLNACEGARVSSDDPFAGVATSLVQREIPAVVAMQFEITDRAAIIFAGEFYSALADGYAVDTALAEARKAIYADHNDVEWGTPVLFMRVPDGRVFDLPEKKVRTGSHPVLEERPVEPPPVEPPPVEPPPPPPPPPVVEEPPRQKRSRRRFVLTLTIALGAIVAAALGSIFAFSGGGGGTATPPPTIKPKPRPPVNALSAAIPEGVTCSANGKPQAPAGTLLADNFSNFVVCSHPDGKIFVQYSLAKGTSDHLEHFFFARRVNARGVRRFTEAKCSLDPPSSGAEYTAWLPKGTAGHVADPTGNGSGTVLCYPWTGHMWRIEWIDKKHRILAFASSTSWTALYRWWAHEAGPK
jgi:hypothetical protein